LAASADALHEPSNRIYEYYFLLQLFRRFRRKAQLFPGSFDATRLRGIKTLREFDDRVTAYYCGFTGADDYYARAAATNVIERIARPTLIIHAANDPFIRLLADTREKIVSNPHITYLETEDGGHCAFFGERDSDLSYDGRWAEREVVEFAMQFR
jgi:predicted alpha/beta-fold hydrolase